MSLAANVCLLLSEWISFLLVAVPPRSRRTFVELLIGCLLNPEGWVTRALRWTLAGFALLILAYVGSRFVAEVILGRI